MGVGVANVAVARSTGASKPASANVRHGRKADAPSLTLSGVKLPEDAEECESEMDRTADRAANWLALHEIVQALYGLFLKDRLRENYRSTGAEAQATWMAK